MFQDRRVREALAMLWDFEWSNRQMMRNMYIRQQSFFSNTALAARQLPDQAELAILEPLRGQIPDEVFTQVFEAPENSTPAATCGTSSCRPWPCWNRLAGNPMATAWSTPRANR